MSIESAKAFVEKLKTDEDFAKQVKDCKDAAARKAFANAEGFDFTKAEIEEVASQLSDEQLDSVAGGCGVDVSCIYDYPWS
ncbi:MAG TPA: Nif11-like leader peptide family natural product precursor [Syntrophomonadaceae bacterium]|nr:Nif11-like leader peptide family natural product precursor [Syntrophomonadaceae bacterium]